MSQKLNSNKLQISFGESIRVMRKGIIEFIKVYPTDSFKDIHIGINMVFASATPKYTPQLMYKSMA